VLGRGGRVDVLVNNAGIGSGGRIETCPSTGRRPIRDEYSGAIRMIHAVLPGIHQQAGAIVSISSTARRVSIAIMVSPASGHAASLRRTFDALALALRAAAFRNTSNVLSSSSHHASDSRHSITRSARTNVEDSIVTPIAVAVLRFRTRSNFLGRSIGMSPAFAPPRIRSTK
jgi:NAD(P)-dependent dehydrogenase (short-subunit alcohol dehydrogenase family)